MVVTMVVTMVVRWATQNRVERCRGEGARPTSLLEQGVASSQLHLLTRAARRHPAPPRAHRVSSTNQTAASQAYTFERGTRSNHWHMLSREAERGAHNGEGALERCALQRRRKLRGRVEPLI